MIEKQTIVNLSVVFVPQILHGYKLCSRPFISKKTSLSLWRLRWGSHVEEHEITALSVLVENPSESCPNISSGVMDNTEMKWPTEYWWTWRAKAQNVLGIIYSITCFYFQNSFSAPANAVVDGNANTKQHARTDVTPGFSYANNVCGEIGRNKVVFWCW